MIFVDTSAWHSVYVPSDQHNKALLAEFKNANDLIVTTDFVIDETITLLQVRGERRRAVQFGRDFLIDGRACVEVVNLKDLLTRTMSLCVTVTRSGASPIAQAMS